MPDIIPGIFQYCNRWCKQCPFTDKCSHYTYRVKGVFPDSQDELSARIKQLFTSFDQVLNDRQEPYSINRDGKSEVEQDSEEYLLLLAMRYADNMFTFIASLQQNNSMQQILQQRIDLGLETMEQTIEHAGLINHYFELLQWFMYLIPAKVNRALTSRAASTESVIQSDENGSAKVVLLAITDSLKLLQELTPYFDEDVLLDKLALLSELKRRLELHFPDAYLFIRPGFDT